MDGMELLKLAVQIAIGLAAGGFTAAGYFAVITSVGMINRIVDVTNTKAYIPYFEEVIIWGASLGNVWFIFDLPLPTGMPGAVLYGLLFPDRLQARQSQVLHQSAHALQRLAVP